MADLKMNGSATTVAFFADGKQMISAGSECHFYVFVKFRMSINKPNIIATINFMP